MKPGMDQKQLLGVVGGLALCLVAGALAWFGLGSLGEKQAETQALAEQLGNPALAALFHEPAGANRASRDAAEIQKLAKEIRENDVEAAKWSAATRELAGDEKEWAKDPGKWKDRLIDVQSRLQKEARDQRIDLAPDFYLGLNEYRQKSPSADEVPNLAVHLSVAERLVRLVMQARGIREQYPTLCEIRALAGPGSEKGAGAKNSGAVPAGKPGPLTTPNERKSFQIEIRSSPEVLYEYVKLLTTDPALLILVDLTVTNEKQAFPLRSEIAKKFSEPKPTDEPSIEKKETKRLLEILGGEENVTTTLKVDYVAWRNPDEAKSVKATPQKP